MKTKPTTSEQNSNGKVPCKNQLKLLADVGVTQPLTIETKNQGQAFLFPSAQPARQLTRFPAGTLNVLFARREQLNNGTTLRITNSEANVGRQRASNHMVITSTIQTKNTALMQAGTYAAVVKAINPVDKVLKDGEKPELEIEFAVVGATEPMRKRYPIRLDGRNPLRREVQAILGRPLSVPEIASFDTDQLLNRNCLVVVGHQHDAGSKPKAVIKSVVAAPVVIPADAAASPAVTPTVAAA